MENTNKNTSYKVAALGYPYFTAATAEEEAQIAARVESNSTELWWGVKIGLLLVSYVYFCGLVDSWRNLSPVLSEYPTLPEYPILPEYPVLGNYHKVIEVSMNNTSDTLFEGATDILIYNKKLRHEIKMGLGDAAHKFVLSPEASSPAPSPIFPLLLPPSIVLGPNVLIGIGVGVTLGGMGYYAYRYVKKK